MTLSSGSGQAQQRPERPAARAGAPAAPTSQPSPIEPRVREVLSDLTPEVSYSFDELVVRLERANAVEACRRLKTAEGLDFKFLRCLSVVDWVKHMEAVYHLSSLSHPSKVVVKVTIPTDDLWMPTMIEVWKGADWHEREGHDLFGIVFDGHPNMKPLILFEGFEGYPGRKSYHLPEQVSFYGD